MKKLSFVLAAFIMLISVSCKSNNVCDVPEQDTLSFNFWQCVDLWEDEETSEYYVEYRLNPKRDSKEFINLYIADEDLHCKFQNYFYYEVSDEEICEMAYHYGIVCNDGKYYIVKVNN